MENKEANELAKMFRFAQGDRERATDFAAKHSLDVKQAESLSPEQWQQLYAVYCHDHDAHGLEVGDFSSFQENVLFNIGVVDNYLKYRK